MVYGDGPELMVYARRIGRSHSSESSKYSSHECGLCVCCVLCQRVWEGTPPRPARERESNLQILVNIMAADDKGTMEAFEAAAGRQVTRARGFYEEQVSTGTAAVESALARGSVRDLQVLQPIVTRLLVNASCRYKQRDPAIKPQRDAFSALCSRINRQLKALGVEPPDGSSSERAAAGSAFAAAATAGAAARSKKCLKAAQAGPRHLCEQMCYFNAYEPHRLLHSFRLAAAAFGHDSTALHGWRGAASFRTGDEEGMAATGDEGGEGVRMRPRGVDVAGRKRQRDLSGTTISEAGGGAILVAPTGEPYASVTEALRALGEPPTASGTAFALASGSRSPPSPGKCYRTLLHRQESEVAGAGEQERRIHPSQAIITSRFFADVNANAGERTETAAAPPPPTRSALEARVPPPSSSSHLARPAALPAATGSESRRPWRPPHSPFGLLEELFWDRPWALLVCCILLNQTSRVQVDSVLSRLLAAWPDAAALASADAESVESILRPLGLHRRRARTLIRFSSEFLKGAWRTPEELPGIGEYAADAHAIFCEGRWREREPRDHALRWYIDWIRTTEGAGEEVAGGTRLASRRARASDSLDPGGGAAGACHLPTRSDRA